MTSIPELRTEGLHPDHADILQRALDDARELLSEVEQGAAAPENQQAGSPWDTDSVTSWVSPHHQKNKKEE